MRKTFRNLFVVAVMTVAFASAVAAAPPDKVVREIFVPETELGALLEGARDRVLIPRQEFEALLKQAREIELAQNQPPAALAPAEAILLASDYTATITDQRVEIEGILEIDLLTDELVAVTLPMSRVALLEATLEGEVEPATLGRTESDDVFKLVLQGRKIHRLKFRVTTPLTVESTRQSLVFQLPLGTRQTFHLSIPGDVEFKAGAAVLSRNVNDGATRFELLLPAHQTETRLLMTLNSHRVGTYRAMLARSVQFAEVTEQYERLHATVSLNELHQGLRDVAFYVPEGFEITDVRSTLLDRWNVEKAEPGQPDKTRDVLKIQFREQIPGLTTINLSAIKTKVELGERWQFPQFESVDAAVDSAVLGLLLEQELEVLDMKTERLYPIDTMTLKDAIPPSALDSLPGSPTLRLALAYYAPRGDWAAGAVFRRPPPDCNLETEQVLVFSEKEPALFIEYRLTPRTGKVFDATIQTPVAWKILAVTDAAGRTLDFRSKTENSVLIRFPEGIAPGSTGRFTLRAVGGLEDWFKSGAEKKLQYPVFQYENASVESGKIHVRQQGEEDWEVVPVTLENLVATDVPADRVSDAAPKSALSFQYDSVPFALELSLEKIVPRIKAKTVSFYRFEPKLLRVRHEIDYTVEQASTRRLVFRLPMDSPPTPDIRGLAGLPVKETYSETVTENGDSFRQWTVELARPMSGLLRVSVDFETPLDETLPVGEAENATPYPLPGILAQNIAWQSKVIAVEGDEELDIVIPTESETGDLLLRPVDVGLLSSAVYQPGKRLLGVFGVLDETAPLAVTMTKNEIDPLIAALVRSVHVVARLEDGKGEAVLYSTLYEIQTGGGSLKAALSENDELWGVTLDGDAIKPQRVGGELLIPVTAAPGTELRRLVLLYRSQVIRNENEPVALSYPELTPAGKENALPLPVMRTTWNVIPPAGYEISRLGDVTPKTLRPQPALFELFRGGVECCSALIRKVDYSRYAPQTRLPNFGCSAKDEMTLPKPTYMSDRHAELGIASIPVPANPSFNGEAESSADKFDVDLKSKSRELNEWSKDVSEMLVVDQASIPVDNLERLDERRSSPQKPAPITLYDNKYEKAEVARGRRLQSAQPVSVVIADAGNNGPASGLAVIGQRYAREIPVRLASQSNANRLGWISLLLTVLVGLGLSNFTRKSKSAFVFGLLTLGTILVFVPGLERFASLLNGIVYGAAISGGIYLILAVVVKIRSTKMAQKDEATAPSPAPAGVSTCAAWLTAVISLLAAHAAFADESATTPKIQFPPDAVIVPYSMTDVDPNRLPEVEELTRPEQSLWVT